MPSGGPGRGGGRKPLANELRTADLARKVLIEKHGSLDAALLWLLQKDEAVLTKFVYEHAFGKSPDKIEGNIDSKISLHIVRGKP